MHLYRLYHQLNTLDVTDDLNWQIVLAYLKPTLSNLVGTLLFYFIFLSSDLLLEVWFFIHHCMSQMVLSQYTGEIYNL